MSSPFDPPPGALNALEAQEPLIRQCAECGQWDDHKMEDDSWRCVACGHVDSLVPRELALPIGARSRDDSITLGQARAELRVLAEDGYPCPCCEQMVKVYKRSIHSSMAAGLLTFFRRYARTWGYVPDALPSDRLSADFPKLRYWQLIEESDVEREDGSSRAGLWRVTGLGEQFVLRQLHLPQYVRVYNGDALGPPSGPMRSIVDCLGDGFDYDDLMSR